MNHEHPARVRVRLWLLPVAVLAVVAGVGLEPEELRRRIREVRQLASRPFGVDLLMPARLARSVGMPSTPISTLNLRLSMVALPFGISLLFREVSEQLDISVVGTRRIEVLAKRDVSYIYLAGRQRPDYRTLARFRRRNAGEIKRLMKEAVLLCARLGMVGLGSYTAPGLARVGAVLYIGGEKGRG